MNLIFLCMLTIPMIALLALHLYIPDASSAKSVICFSLVICMEYAMWKILDDIEQRQMMLR